MKRSISHLFEEGQENLKLISDIRFFEGSCSKVNSRYIGEQYQITNEELFPIKERLLMKLREKNFYLVDFDHIYINFTTERSIDFIEISERPLDKCHTFFKYVDIGVSPERFNNLSKDNQCLELIENTVKVLQLFCRNDSDKMLVRACADEVVKNGIDTEIKYKCKNTPNNYVEIIVKILDLNHYIPFIRIYNSDNNLFKEISFEKRYNRMEFIYQFGGILSLSRKNLIIKPRKNSFYNLYELEILKYDLI